MKRIMQAAITAIAVALAQSAWSEEAIEPVSAEAVPEIWTVVFVSSDAIEEETHALEQGAEMSDDYAESDSGAEVQVSEASEDETVGHAE